jgi:protein-tyrosine kinase
MLAQTQAAASELAAIPLTIDPETLEENRIVGFESHDERARSFNLLRSQIMRWLESNPGQIIGVTSATPAAGKTFVALNLAAAISELTGRSALLCDLDLRRGSVIRSLGARVDVDLAGYLRGEVDDWRRAVHRVDGTDLHLLPCISALKRSTALLTTDRFDRLMSDLRGLPPEMVVICDLPPVFASDDALLTAKHLDQYLLVVEHGQNTARQVREAIALLEPTPCLGTVLNRYRGGFFDAYGYGYGDPYGIKNYGKDVD